MITRVEVKNYKCLADVRVDLTPVHAIIGPNDSGKTSFLEAVVALVNWPRANRNSLPPGWDGQELVWRGSSDGIATFKGVVTTSTRQEVVSFAHALHFREAGQAPKAKTEYEPDTDATRAIVGSLASATLCRFVPDELARPAGFNPQQLVPMDSTGHGLAILLDDILSDDRERFTALESEFCAVFPRYSRLVLRRAEAAYRVVDQSGLVQYNRVSGKRLLFVEKSTGGRVRAAQSSDGTLIILALLALKHLPEPPSVVLIEEPENSIHPQRLADVVRIMREIVCNGPQVIMSSHSPYLLDYLEPEEVTVFTRGEDGAAHCLRMSDSAKVKREIKHFNLGEIWTADWEEKLLAKAEEGADA